MVTALGDVCAGDPTSRERTPSLSDVSAGGGAAGLGETFFNNDEIYPETPQQPKRRRGRPSSTLPMSSEKQQLVVSEGKKKNCVIISSLDDEVPKKLVSQHGADFIANNFILEKTIKEEKRGKQKGWLCKFYGIKKVQFKSLKWLEQKGFL